MFDIGFSELLVIALVGLIVIGPERLPKVSRTVGHLLGRLQRYVSDVKADINREMQLDELKKLQAQVQEQARDMERSVNEQMNVVETSLNQSILTAAEGNAAVAPAESAAEDTAAAAITDTKQPAATPPAVIPPAA